MRHQILKLRISRSTKAERRALEVFKRHHVLFRAKVIIKGREIDFVIGKYTIDIDGHPQDSEKNRMLIGEGYAPIHFFNHEIPQQLELWLEHHYSDLSPRR